MKRFLLLPAAALFVAGCNSFHLSQVDSFIDDDGNMVRVEYGTLEKARKYFIESPVNGQKVECQSKLMVCVHLPDERCVKCYFGQNDFSRGTMYTSDDGRWKYLTTGLECAVFYLEKGAPDHLLVYQGTACGNVDDRKGGAR